MAIGKAGAKGGTGSLGALGGVGIPPPPGAPATAKLLLGTDGAPLKGADGAYLWSIY